MRADPNERVTSERPAKSRQLPVLLALAVVALAVGVVVYMRAPEPSEPAPTPVPPVVELPKAVAEPERVAPDIPRQPPSEPVLEQTAEPPEPVLTLEDSDAAVQTAMDPVMQDSALAPLTQTDNILSRAVAVIDGVARGIIPYKLLPLQPPSQMFAINKVDRQTYMSADGYVRYDAYARAVAELDAAATVATFHRFRPLLEEAYALLGYEPEGFDNTLISSLDEILSAPVMRGPIELRKVEAVYKYEDPSLERASEVHRQLLRMGPDNTERVQAKARELRALLVTP